jgi:serine phosphatase RsbU (regulator of sigma subunit)
MQYPIAPGAAGRRWPERAPARHPSEDGEGRLRRLLNVPAWPAPAAAVACVALLVVITVTGVALGTKIQLSPLYFLPIIIASLRFQTPGGLTVAGASALLAAWPSSAALRQVEEPLMFTANALTEGLGFSFVALVTGALQRQGQRLRQQRQELETAQRELQADMRAAELLQGHLLRRPLPEVPGLDLAAEIVFARGVGGDFYDLRRVDGDLAICVADVSGKGAQAALISAALRGLLDEAAARPTDPAPFLQHLNERLSATLPDEMFVTMFYGRLDLASGELRYASAGHDPPLLCRGERVEELPPTGPALGLGIELPPRAGRTTLRPGEILLLYTDGLTTARHPMGGRVGEERVAAWLQLGAALPPAELVAELLRLACVAGPAPLEDDVAVIALRRRG